MTIVSANDTPEQIADAMRAHGYEPVEPSTQPQANPQDIPPEAATDDNPDAPPSADGTTGTDSDPAQPATEQVPPTKEAAKRSKIQERIDELTAQRYQEKGRGDQLERELAELKAKLAGTPAKPDEATPEPEQAGPALIEKPGHPGKAPRFNQFDSVEEYETAMDDHEAKLAKYQDDLTEFNRQEARLEAQRQFDERENQRVQGEMQAAWNAKLDAAKADLPDFDDTMKAATSQIAAAMMDAVQESDHSAKILYWLAKHPEDADAIFSQTYYDLRSNDRNAALIANRHAARAVARIEYEVAKPAAGTPAAPRPPAAAPKPPAPRQVSKAPDPITPTRGGGSAGSPDARNRVIGQNGWTAEKERQLMTQKPRRR